MNDPKVEESLRRLADRGTPRGADRVYEDASRVDPVVRPLDGQPTPDSGRQSTGRARYAIAAVVIAVVAAGGVAYSQLEDDGGTVPVSSGPLAFCEVMATATLDSSNTISVYLEPSADADVVAAIGAAIDGRPEVESFAYVDAEESYARFTELFPDDEQMVEHVASGDLPTSYVVELIDRSADAKQSFSEAVERLAGVYELSPRASGPRVIDVIELGLMDRPLRADLVDGLVVHLGELDEVSVPVSVRHDLDLVTEALTLGLAQLDPERRSDALRSSVDIVSYVDETCDLPRSPDATPSGSGVATTEAVPGGGR